MAEAARPWMKRSVSVMTFNVLAKIYEHPEHLNGTAAFSQRCSMVAQRIWDANCDIVCLNEVNPSSWYRDAFSGAYDIFFAPKVSHDTVLTSDQLRAHVDDGSDGSAVMVRRGVFDVVAAHHLRVKQPKTESGDLTAVNPSDTARQMALAVEVYHVATQKRMVVCTMHMKANGMDGIPGASNDATRVCHLLQLLPELQRVANGNPILFAGDFNAKPEDPTMDLLLRGKVDINGRKYFRSDSLQFVSGMVEAFGKEPEMTLMDSFHDAQGWWATLDYVLWEKGRWAVTGALGEPKRSAHGPPDAIPLSGSDHFPLVFDLLML